MRKSVWLLSAGFVALSTPGFRSGNTEAAPRHADRPDRGAAVAAADARTARRSRSTRSSSPPRAAARRFRTFRSRSPPSPREDDAELRRHRHPPAQPARPVAAGLLDRVRSQRGSARIRGIGTVGDNPGLESSVAVFIDGVYRSRTGIGLNELGEIERIEVLRGPQGTLFGRNASAGLINIITKKPRFTLGGLRRSRRSAITICAARARHHRPAQRHARGAPRRRLCEARRLLRRRQSRRHATSTTATASSCAASCCSSRTTSSRSG